VFQVGVMRSYAVRHGPGPLPTETNALRTVVSEHNKYNEWQGRVRYGWFDGVLARYALNVTAGTGSLAVTHMDMLPRLKTWKYCPGYQKYNDLYDTSAVSTISNGVLTDFQLPAFLALEQRSQLTHALSTVTPVFSACEADDETVIREIESLTGQQIGIISRGPSATDVQMMNSFPQ
jgi:adenylosuccinate synthase